MLLDFDFLIKKYNLKIKGVIHIGAHYGEEHLHYKKHNIENLSYFEPLKKNFKVLEEKIKDKSLLFNIALGNDNSQIDMFVESNNNGQSSSILKPILHLNQYPYIVFNEVETVQMKKLDDVGLVIGNYNLINIDVQGYELEVFKGASKILDSIDYIITEVNRDEVYENCAKVDQLDLFLKNYGFERVETSWDGHTWGDAFYLKQK